MQPKQIKVKDEMLLLVWDDGNEWKISLKYLRDECPCAGCKGETVLFRTYRPAGPTATTPDAYKITAIKPVGGYAIQISWKDNHDTGIYSWEYLKRLHNGESSREEQNYKPLV